MIKQNFVWQLLIIVSVWAVVAFYTATVGVAQAGGNLRVALPTLPHSLVNPFRTAAPPSIYITGAIFDTLIRFDENHEIQPGLITAWEREDELTWRLTLRQGVLFSNGEQFDAEAVVTSITFLASEESLTEGIRREIDFLTGAEAVDSYTVRIFTRLPVPFLPRYLAALPIVAPQHWLNLGLADFARNPIGTGPFKLDQWQTSGLRLRAFEGAWRKPILETVEFTAVPNPSSRVAGILSDTFDVALDIGPDDIAILENGGDKAYSLVTDSVAGISFVTDEDSPFQDVRVRRAMNLAIDRDALVSVLLSGATVPASQPATRFVLGYNPELQAYAYDPDRAKALLAEAGYDNGFTFDFETTIGYEPNDAAIFQQISQYLSNIGVRMNVIVIPSAEFLTRRSNGRIESQAFSAEWASWPTLDSLRAVTIHSCLRRPVTWFCDEASTAQILDTLQEGDLTKAISNRRSIMKMYRDLAPALFLFEVPQFWGLRNEVQNFKIIANKILFNELRLDTSH